MIAYAACIADRGKFDRICLPGLQRVMAPDDRVIETSSNRSIFEAYNEVLDAVRDWADLEALVLLHEDTEITDAAFADIVRRELADPDVGIVGAVGGVGARGIAWWEGEIRGWVAESRGVTGPRPAGGDVDAVDGLIMVLSPWAFRTLRFDDEWFSGFDGYDADLCRQARAAGRRVVAVDLPVFHAHDRTGEDRAVDDGQSYSRADAAFRAKWNTVAGPGTLSDDELMARRALLSPPLAALVPADARRILDVGPDGCGRRDALTADRPAALVDSVETLDDVADEELYDTVVMAEALEATTNPDATLMAARGMLSPGGALVFSVPNPGAMPIVQVRLMARAYAPELVAESGTSAPHHLFTLRGMFEALRRCALTPVGMGLTGYDVRAVDPGMLREFTRIVGNEEMVFQRLSGTRFFVSAVPSAEEPRPRPAPRRGTQVDRELLDLLDGSEGRVARVDSMLGETGDVVADADMRAAFGSLGGDQYDAVVLGTALRHALHPGEVLRAAREIVRPGGAVLASVENVLYAPTLLGLLEHDEWSDEGGAHAHHPVAFFAHRDLRTYAADGGLYIDRTVRVPGPFDRGQVAEWMTALAVLEVPTGELREELGIERMRLVMRRPDLGRG
ncbi:MAG: hypothetical protein KDC33_10165 [Thermoleophilia bacterium]|nr:hypothetical protein [Thermoleophilia bacterium]